MRKGTVLQSACSDPGVWVTDVPNLRSNQYAFPHAERGGPFTNAQMDAAHAEPKGYLCCTQAPDGMIHLLSSMMHYQFNLAWLKALPPAAGEEPA